jgi:hypothetical protein
MRIPSLSLSALLLCGAIAASAPAFAQVGVDFHLGVAPPPVVVETAPPPRVGYVWAPGYWRWRPRLHRHVWVHGHWIPAREGWHWVPEHWVPEGPNWHFVPGHWAR